MILFIKCKWDVYILFCFNSFIEILKLQGFKILPLVLLIFNRISNRIFLVLNTWVKYRESSTLPKFIFSLGRFVLVKSLFHHISQHVISFPFLLSHVFFFCSILLKYWHLNIWLIKYCFLLINSFLSASEIFPW